MKPDYYATLGVRTDASSAEIRRAWRALARLYHPDRGRGAEGSPGRLMARINEAWATLGDPLRRQAYDATLLAPEPPEVQDAMLRATDHELSARGWVRRRGSAGSVLEHSRRWRIRVHYTRVLTASGLTQWVRSVSSGTGVERIDCGICFACRVLAREGAALHIGRASCPLVVVDLIRGEGYGSLPHDIPRALFAPVLPADR